MNFKDILGGEFGKHPSKTQENQVVSKTTDQSQEY
jgi:hypothetical protein